MEGPQFIEVELPERLGDEDRDALSSVLKAVVALRFEKGDAWRDIRRRLLDSGWKVEYGLQWHVVANCGREHEEACGRTRDEAFAKLDQVAHARILEGTP